ncbi:hypothetical protein FOIG_14952 [Fusarium odoratissimum NRRL 54006]|uniref:Uncharacterized protein n=1 Tax=Fusarium odoratissimum (strain NRRL 54006) TaxID=1089451 RepID=X0ISH0_FUSO5|nr:uncharacterized protein FOIG_14952 [Fusarium odoratissimum NRRL 54006]EXL91843.1 hypothetical protein FOIG_14952 [Fusarium odoratissimum NRRL 54006]
MSRDSRDHSSTHDCTTEVELYPRTTTQAIAVTEGHNGEGSLRPSQGDICHGQSSASQSSTPERLQSLAQTSDQVSDTQVRDMGSTNRPAKSSSSKPPLSEDFGLEAGAAVAVQGHTSQNVTVENERLSPQVERMLLDAARDKMLFMLGATNQDPGNISISDYGFKTMHFKFDVRGSKPVKFGWESLSESADGIEAAQVNKAILDAWPETRESGWVSQDIIESDGRNPAIKVQWSSVGKAYQDDLNAVDKGPLAETRRDNIVSCGFESLWHSWCYAAKRERYKRQKGIIHWQIRYYRPISANAGNDLNCLLSKRQSATIGKGPEAVCLEEKRVRISFRVLKGNPRLFSIFVLVDDWRFIGTDVPHEIDDVKVGWERYGLKPRQKVIPITHYLFEICRVFEKCMEAWGEALDAIDGLVHVDLNDLDGQSRVEDPMFDKSFDRSKDYFVALQLLRIVDEWLDEVAPSVKELQKDPYLRFTSICAAETVDNFNAAIRSIDERTAVIQKRVRKKVEEVNSLRDGLFNATSLRESTKAMALNQAIYVFTVVTVLFTPVSFLAVSDILHQSSVSQLTGQTFWALPFLNNPTEGTDIVPVPSSFRNSFIIMPLLTYALVIGVAWFVGQRNGTNALLDLLRELREILGQLIRSAWSLLPRIPRRGSGRSPYP